MNSLNFLDWQKVKFKHTQGYKPVYSSRDLCFLPGDWLLYPLQKCPCSQPTVSRLDKIALENLLSKRYTKNWKSQQHWNIWKLEEDNFSFA